MFKNILLGGGVLAALMAILIFSGKVPGFSKKNTVTGEVTIWGTFPQDQTETLLQAFNTEARTYRVNYVEIPEAQFSSKLVNALASGGGPDMILAPYQVILENRERIAPFPVASFSVQQFKNLYVDGTSILLSDNGALALPISIEPLMLFYNRALFAKHGVIVPPTTWDEVTSMVSTLTVLQPGTNLLLESGIALGSVSNIPQTKDILMTLVAQLGQIPVIRDLASGQERFTVSVNRPAVESSDVLPLTTSLRFFTDFSDFSKTTYTWNSVQPQSIDQFVAEKLSMYIGFYGDVQLLRQKNPRLDFGVKMLPQAKGYPTVATGMRLYGLATLKRSTNMVTSFTVEGALSGGVYGPRLASIVGGISPLREVLTTDATLDTDAKQSVLVAKGWYDVNFVTTANYIQSMVNDVLSGRSGVTEASTLFVSRMTELYTGK